MVLICKSDAGSSHMPDRNCTVLSLRKRDVFNFIYKGKLHFIKIIHRLNAVPIKTIVSFFTEIGKVYTKIDMEPQKTLNSQNYPEPKEQY